jgi:hypothetical protein
MIKNIFYTAILIISISGLVFSQPADKYFFSITGTGGVYIPNGQIAYEFKPGISGGAEIQYGNINRAIFLNVQYNSFVYKGFYNRDKLGITNYTLVNESNSSLTEIAAGVRFYFGEKKIKAFGEGGAGFYTRQRNAFTESYTDGTIQYMRARTKSTQSKLWLNIGAGILFSVSKNVVLLLKGKLHLSGEGEDIITFSGFYTGVKINL